MGARYNHAHADLDAEAPAGLRKRHWGIVSSTAPVVIAQVIVSLSTGSLPLFTDSVYALVDASGLLVANVLRVAS